MAGRDLKPHVAARELLDGGLLEQRVPQATNTDGGNPFSGRFLIFEPGLIGGLCGGLMGTYQNSGEYETGGEGSGEEDSCNPTLATKGRRKDGAPR
jgi:hypothetical protein